VEPPEVFHKVVQQLLRGSPMFVSIPFHKCRSEDALHAIPDVGTSAHEEIVGIMKRVGVDEGVAVPGKVNVGDGVGDDVGVGVAVGVGVILSVGVAVGSVKTEQLHGVVRQSDEVTDDDDELSSEQTNAEQVRRAWNPGVEETQACPKESKA